jgi:hypothetical protein
MSAWYFLFEGRFSQGDPSYGLKGVCSSCIVPRSEYDAALELFVISLKKNDIILTLIEDSFQILPQELDSSMPENQSWLKWHDEAIRKDVVLFDPWQVFDPEDQES